MIGVDAELIGLQLFPYDVVDEGEDLVISNAQLAGATTLLPAVNYIREDQPIPAGELPHNGKRRRYVTDGGLYFRPDARRYPTTLLPPETGEDIDAEAALRGLTDAASARGLNVIPWLSLLNGRVAETGWCSVVNVRGERVAGWLCPSQDKTREYVRALVGDVLDQFRASAVFMDRFRFPEWGSNGPADLFTCFCDSCFQQAQARGVDIDRIREHLLNIVDSVEKDPAGAVEAAQDAVGCGLRMMRSLSLHRVVLDWLTFRHLLVERIAIAAHEAAMARSAKLWLDVWPPSYGWVLGQDLARLGRYGEWTKPFTYHKLAGGANIAGMISTVAPDQETGEALYSVFQRFFGFRGPNRFSQFADKGLDPEFISSESVFARSLLGGRSKLAAGLQLWQVGPSGVRTALEHARLADPDGFIFYCYGWASVEELAAAGEWLRERRSRLHSRPDPV